MSATVLNMYPRDCEQCECQHYTWDLISGLLRSQPNSQCRCGHWVARHRYRPMSLACGRYNGHFQCSEGDCKCSCHPASTENEDGHEVPRRTS
jgi:hypothetical protein